MPSTEPFAALIEPHLEKLYRLAYRLTASVADAEDLVQDVLIKLYMRRAELADIAALDIWTKRVLYNQFVDNARRYSRMRIVPIEDLPHGVDQPAAEQPSVADASNEFDKSALHAAIAELSSEHRTVLLMHDAEGYKLEEIQEITGVALGTLKSRLHRARERLRGLLEADGTF